MGSYEETGVRLRAINEATPGVDAYIRDLNRVVKSGQQVVSYFQQAQVAASGFASNVVLVAEANQKAAAKQQQATQSSIASVSRYATAILSLSGIAQSAGVNVGAVGKAATLASGAMIGFGGPVGAAVVALTAFVAITQDALAYEKNLQKETAAHADVLLRLVQVKGVQSEAERRVAQAAIANAEAQIKQAEATLQAALAGRAQLSMWRELTLSAIEAAAAVAEFNGQVDIFTALMVRAATLRSAWESALNEKEIAESAATIRKLREEIEAWKLGLAGGSKGAKEFSAHLDRMNQLQREAETSYLRSLQSMEAFAEARDRNIVVMRREAGEAYGLRAVMMNLAQVQEFVARETYRVQLELAEQRKNEQLRKLEEEKIGLEQKLEEELAIRKGYNTEAVALESDLQARLEAIRDAAERRRQTKVQEQRQLFLDAWDRAYAMWVETSQAASKIVGAAIGAAAAGATDSWRNASIAMVELAVQAASRMLEVWAAASIALGQWAKAARIFAGIAILEGIGAAAVGYLQERERQRQARTREEEEDYERARETPDIDVYNSAGWTPRAPAMSTRYIDNSRPTFAPSLTIALSSGGQDATQAWRQSADEWMDQQMRRWMDRERLKNGGRVLA